MGTALEAEDAFENKTEAINKPAIVTAPTIKTAGMVMAKLRSKNILLRAGYLKTRKGYSGEKVERKEKVSKQIKQSSVNKVKRKHTHQ